MSYSDLYFNQKKGTSPILFGIALLSLVGFMAFFFKTGNVTTSKASKIKIASHRIVNLSPQEVGIFWQTNVPQESSIIYGEVKPEKFILDERDSTNQKQAYIYHYAIIRNLSESKKYYYRIVTDEGMFPALEEEPLFFTTPYNRNIRSNLRAAYGKVMLINTDKAVENAFVFLNFEKKYYSLMTMTKSDGSFVIPLNYFVDLNTNDEILPDPNEVTEIEIFNNSNRVKIKAKINQTNNLPTIILGGEDKDLTQVEQVLAATTKTETKNENTKNINESMLIIFPKENSIIPASRPLIKGVVTPNKSVIISINSKPEYVFRTQANKIGEWKVVPEKSINAGDYILTLTSEDEKGNQYLVKRNFSIAKNGEQVLGEATAEPTLEPTTQAVPLSTPTTTLISPTTDINQYITPTASPPVSGSNNSNWLIIISSSLMIIGLGVLFVF